MKLFKWLPGRQPNITYKKLCFLQIKLGRIAIDGYILVYQPGNLPWHTDPVVGAKHWRLNIKLLGDCDFFCKKEIFKLGEFIHLFRPDIMKHSLIVWSRTVKLSFGFAKFERYDI